MRSRPPFSILALAPILTVGSLLSRRPKSGIFIWRFPLAVSRTRPGRDHAPRTHRGPSWLAPSMSGPSPCSGQVGVQGEANGGCGACGRRRRRPPGGWQLSELGFWWAVTPITTSTSTPTIAQIPAAGHRKSNSVRSGCDRGVGGNSKFPIRGNRKPHTLVVGGLCPAFHDVGESNSEGAGGKCTDGRRGCC